MTQQKRLRRLAILAAGAVASTALAAVGVASTTIAASAAPAAPATFTWAFSEYIKRPAPAGQFAVPVVSDGASYEAASGKVTFVGGTGRTDTGSHVTSVAYDGAAAFSDSHGGDSYTVTFSDPTVAVDSVGNGTLSADVAWSGAAVTAGSVQDVTLTSFTAAEAAWSGPFALTATPDWTGEVPADAYGTGNPKDGKSWAQAFVTALPSSIQGFFYASTISSDSSNAAKVPAPFDVVIPGPKVAATTSAQSPAGISLSVAGSGFTAVTNPGDAGVYVGLAPAGGLPDVSTMDAMDNFADAKYVTPGQIVNGAFTTSLSATPDLLKSGTAYAVYTWQAHEHSNTTQDTETPVTIDWSKLTVAPPAPTKPATKVRALVTKKPTTAKGGALKVTLKGTGGTPAGKVTVKLTSKGKKAVTRTAKAKNGKAVVKLPKLKAGSWKATVVYAGSDTFKSAKVVVGFKVKKAKKK
jgi:hypothetical protein